MLENLIAIYSINNIIGVEKNNDVAKHTYYSSNKHDPCGEVIRMERRQDTLQHCKREKRPYTRMTQTTGPREFLNRGRDNGRPNDFFFQPAFLKATTNTKDNLQNHYIP